jgi:hypothetical protein
MNLQGFSRYASLEDCLKFIAVSLDRAGMTESHLPPYQQSLLRDLDEPLDEEALASMVAWWRWDLNRLRDRDKRYSSQFPKPRIDVLIEMTSKGNLKAEWFPRDHRGWSEEGSDFTHFDDSRNRDVGYHSRPSNELFFIRNVEHATCTTRLPDGCQTAVLDHVLLTACIRVLERLKRRLNYHFDVRMLTDIFVEWAEEDEGSGWESVERGMAKFEIDDPVARRRAAELDELENLQERHGFSEEAINAAREIVESRKRPTGPAPSAHTLTDRIVKELKANRLPATKGKVERAMRLIEQFRQAPETGRVDGVVIPFRRDHPSSEL